MMNGESVVPNFLKVRKEKDCIIVNNSELEIFFLNRSAAVLFAILVKERNRMKAFKIYKEIFRGKVNDEELLKDFNKCLEYFIEKRIFLLN